MRKATVWGWLVLLGVFAVNPAFAQGSCEANFKVSGDPRNGSAFVTYVTIPNLDPHVALGQMEKIALDAGFVMGSENYDGDVGTLTVVQKDHSTLLHPQPGFPVLIRASKADNRLAIALQLNQGQTTNPEALRSQLCGMLGKVTMDSSGAAIAAQQHAQTHSDEIVNVKAVDLASELSRKPFSKGLDPQSLQQQYYGRVYRIDGQVKLDDYNKAWAGMNNANYGTRSIDLPFYTDPTGMFGNKVPAKTQIICHTDSKQFERFMQLRDRDYATLIGKVVQFGGNAFGGTLYLDCHFEN